MHDSASTDVNQRGGATRSSEEAFVMSVERRGCIKLSDNVSQLSEKDRRKLRDQTKPFVISKWDVQAAYEKVKFNLGGAGIDGASFGEV